MRPMSFITLPSIRWCQDLLQVLVVDEQTGCITSLTGFEAALWKWFSLSYNYADVLEFSKITFNKPAEETSLLIDQIIDHWVDRGLLAPESVR